MLLANRDRHWKQRLINNDGKPTEQDLYPHR